MWYIEIVQIVNVPRPARPLCNFAEGFFFVMSLVGHVVGSWCPPKGSRARTFFIGLASMLLRQLTAFEVIEGAHAPFRHHPLAESGHALNLPAL